MGDRRHGCLGRVFLVVYTGRDENRRLIQPDWQRSASVERMRNRMKHEYDFSKAKGSRKNNCAEVARTLVSAASALMPTPGGLAPGWHASA